MVTSLGLLVAAVAAAALLLLVGASIAYPAWPEPTDFAFWTVAALVGSAAAVQLPRGIRLTVSATPILAATFLLGPAAGGLVALLGSTDLRELRRQVPWYGTLYNHAAIVLPAIAAGIVYWELGPAPSDTGTAGSFIAAAAAGSVNLAINSVLVGASVALRQHRSLVSVLHGDFGVVAASLLALVPLGWLMAHVYVTAGAWAALLLAVPLYTTRTAYANVVEIRKMFTQTVKALASAVDARDPKTALHSAHVSAIAVDIGRAMGCTEKQLEELEWGGLLHDVGKIGVRDDVLLKPGLLSREERLAMNAHPAKGEEILRPVERLAPELPLIRHHHEWYNGSGYPDRLVGEQIPFLARILHVADAFEAMTAVRPYRVTPLTRQQALEELRRFSGIQFDPQVVEAFERTGWATGEKQRTPPADLSEPIPLLGQVAAMRASGRTAGGGVAADPR